ncbi:MAG: type III-A CRISPR-associated protein Csm2 [Saprospiraceae bacterium]|nr:type III-A CRISPR-associated protein Csm2 [Saprospiraceae bacterium]
MSYKLENFKSDWIGGQLPFNEDTVQFAQEFGAHLCDLQNDRPGREALTTSQIRNFFGEVRRIQAKVQQGGFDNNKVAFLLIRPKLAYAEARVKSKQGKSRIEDFRKVMEKAHLAVKDQDSFQRFVDFLEATLAFHKSYGGRD